MVSQRNRTDNYSSHQQTTADSWRTISLTPLPFRRILLFRGKWLEAWFDGMNVWFHYIQDIPTYFILQPATISLRRKGPKVETSSHPTKQWQILLFSSFLSTWKCIYKWLVSFPFLLWGEVGPTTARMCQCAFHLVTYFSLHSRKLTNIVPEKLVVLETVLSFCVN